MFPLLNHNENPDLQLWATDYSAQAVEVVKVSSDCLLTVEQQGCRRPCRESGSGHAAADATCGARAVLCALDVLGGRCKRPGAHGCENLNGKSAKSSGADADI